MLSELLSFVPSLKYSVTMQITYPPGQVSGSSGILAPFRSCMVTLATELFLSVFLSVTAFQILVPVGFIQSVAGPVIIFFTPDRIRRPAEGDGPGENIGAAEGGQEDENREGFHKHDKFIIL